MDPQQKVYISYAWGGESERIVNELDTDLQNKGITIIRDKRDLGFKGMIRDFMQQIGRGHAVIAVISDKYLKSPNCMFELVEIARNKDFYDRIFPVVLTDADIYNPVNRIKYIKYWEDKVKELDEAMKSVSSANLQGMREEIDSYDEIRDNISNLTFFLKDMNTLTPEMHEDSNFAGLISALEKRLAEEDVPVPVNPVLSKPAAAPVAATVVTSIYLNDVLSRLTGDEYQELRGERAGGVKFKKAVEKIRKGFLGSKDRFRVLFVECNDLNESDFAEIEKEVRIYAKDLCKKLIDTIFVTCVVLSNQIPDSVKDQVLDTPRPKVGISDVNITVMVCYSAAENDIFYPRELPDDYDSHYEENIKQYLLPS